MHKELEFINGKVIVKNDNNKKEERNIIPNIKQILISENDIEEMENIIDYENNNITRYKKKIKNHTGFYLTTVSLWGVSVILNLMTCESIFTPIYLFLIAITQCLTGVSYVKAEKKYLKISKQKIDIIKEHLHKEKENLKQLNENTNIKTNSIDMSKANLSTSEKIINLKRKLDIINDYLLHKNKYIKDYKNGSLNLTLYYYSVDEINLIIELIKNDLNIEKESIKEKRLSK